MIVEPNSTSAQIDGEDDTTEPGDIVQENDVNDGEESVGADSAIVGDPIGQQNDSVETYFDSEDEINISENRDDYADAKDPLAIVILEQAELVAIGDVFDGNDEIEATEERASGSVEFEVIETLPDGTQQITKDLGDECQMVFKVGANVFKPQESGYLVKVNDSISGNLPFKENVSYSWAMPIMHIDYFMYLKLYIYKN